MQPFSKMQSGSVAGGVSMADEFEVAPPEETQLIAGMDEVQVCGVVFCVMASTRVTSVVLLTGY